MQGFNMGRYVPPHLEGTTSFNRASGKPPVSRNADGSQTVRFECPFAIWCTSCTPETIIAQGVRFNAHKKKVGDYYSTPIWAFRFKHTVCGGWVEVRTDPKNTEYVVVEGGRRRDLGAGDRGEDGEILVGLDAAGIEGVLGKLEKRREGEVVVEREKERVEELKRRSERDWADPYEMNKRMRREFRVGRRQRQQDEKTGEGLKDKFGLGLDLVAPSAEDESRAKLVDFGGSSNGNSVSRGLFEEVEQPPIKTVEKDRRKRGKNNLAAEKKAALRNNLRDNTRARTDPFWKEEDIWQQPTRRRRDNEQGESDACTMKNGTSTKAALVAYDSD